MKAICIIFRRKCKWLRVVLHGVQMLSPQRHCFLDLWPTVQVMARPPQKRKEALMKGSNWKWGESEKELKITHKILLINTQSKKASSSTAVTSLKTNLTGQSPADLLPGTTVTLAVGIHQDVNLALFCAYLFGHLREKQREKTVRAAKGDYMFIGHTEGYSTTVQRT